MRKRKSYATARRSRHRSRFRGGVGVFPHFNPVNGHREFDAVRAVRIIQSHKNVEGPALVVLQALQDEFGYIDDACIPLVAHELQLSRAEVVGVVHFYHDFKTAPGGAHLLKVCRAEACQSMGCERLVQHAEASLGTPMDSTTTDGSITIESVYCLGNCALSPAVMLDGDLHGGMTNDKFDALVAHARSQVYGDIAGATLSGGLIDRTDEHERPASPHTRIFVPCDSAALSVGADDVAAEVVRVAAERGLNIELVRNGSRGMLWLEPLVEIETPRGRIAFGPVSVKDVASVLDPNAGPGPEGSGASLHLGLTEEIPFFKNQERLTFARVGVTDPLALDEYVAHGGFEGLKRALTMAPAEIVEEVVASGLRGRGGAGFPTGIKWRTVLGEHNEQKYIVCNADEGDSGTYADRMLMEGDPYCLIEGMTIAGLAVNATKGYVYIRSEYPYAYRTMVEAIERAREAGYLGPQVAGTGPAFDMEARLGAGAYICGEETSLLESLEGKKGVIRFKPPLPAIEGLFGKPTVVNNVLSLASVPIILAKGAQFYADYGMGRSRGTMPLQLAGNVKQGGLFEKAFGLTLRQAIYDYGGGTATERPLRAVQVGGPLGAYFPESLLDTPLDYEAMAGQKGMLGHGGIVVFDDSVDMARQARFAMEFCALESCGKCTPCRIGSTRGVEVIDKIIAGQDRAANLDLLDDLCETMTDASLCLLGGLTPFPVQSAVRHFPEDFDIPVRAVEERAT
jgi:formate dehydrogenase iron-sulfur subunit